MTTMIPGASNNQSIANSGRPFNITNAYPASESEAVGLGVVDSILLPRASSISCIMHSCDVVDAFHVPTTA